MNFKPIVATVVAFALLCMHALAIAESGANIAVAGESALADAPISQVAARCAYFLFFNESGELVEALANPYQHQRREAGPQVVQLLSQKGVHTVIAGEFGAKMIAALKQKNMAFRTDTGRAAEAVRRIRKQ
jgi:predicted Fe-Mo cluster-binding NifX family protein